MIHAFVRILGMFGLFAATVGFAIIGGYVGLFLSGSLGCLFIYTLGMSLWLNQGDIHAERMLHQRFIHSGDQIEVTITISVPARYWLCWIVVEECWIQQKYSEVPAKPAKLEEHYACLAYFRGARDMKCHYTTSAKARGLYRVHSSRVVIGDMFGLVRRVLTQVEQDAETIRVYPVALAGSWYNRMHLIEDIPTDYGTLRDYINGDPISSIDWKSYARYQSLKTKQLEAEEEQKSILIVMDAMKTNFETIVSAVTRMVLEMNAPNLQLTLVCGERRCMVHPYLAYEKGISPEVYEWLSSIEPFSATTDSLNTTTFMEQLGKLTSSAGASDTIIGVTAAHTDQTQREYTLLNDHRSILLIRIPIAAEELNHSRAGELNYA